MEVKTHKIIEKPWGREIWITKEEKYAAKILEIKRGERSSLHYHKKKKETMYILKGKLKILVDGKEFLLTEGESITLNPGEVHRLIALEDISTIEASTPEFEDVIRVEDDYGRK